MNQFKGTPGPYTKNGTSITGNGNTELVAIVYGFDTSERKANAHLIAAAPDMLEALQELVARAEIIVGCSTQVAKAKAAINKALNVK